MDGQDCLSVAQQGVLVATIANLPHLRTLDVSVSRKDPQGFPESFNEEAVQELFNHNDGLPVVRVYSGPPVERDAPRPLASTWRRTINGMEFWLRKSSLKNGQREIWYII